MGALTSKGMTPFKRCCKKMMTKTLDEIINLCGTLSNKHRLCIIAALSGKRKYTSELLRELEISRPLLCLHLRNLEEMGILKGKTELGKGNRARRYYELCNFELYLNGKKIKEMLENEKKDKKVKK
ncbi:transcriptional regulator [ANME-1 cluster archaeon AG-394-G06]|nr:transcriptional regulator [ANME-1 cluster archaeon AG-394-G06]